MKLNKLMFAAVAFGALTFVACNKQGDTPVGPVGPVGPGGGDDPEPEVEIPEVAAPGAGKATIVIQIPEGTECNGIAFKGTLDGAAWSGENTYVGEGTAAAGPDACIKFEKIADTKVWYKATYTLGEAGLKGKICLIYTNDGSWQGQAVNWEIIDDYTTADNGQSNDGNLEIYAEGLVYVKIGGWQNSECLVPEDYKITVIVPEFCDGEFDIELIGSFCGWADDATVALAKVEGNKYSATIKANANAEWKVRGKGSWDKEIQIYRAEDDPATTDFDEADTWGGVPNNVLGDVKDVTVDYSDAEKYRWNVCGSSAEE